MMKKILIAAISVNGLIAHDENEFTGWTSKEDKEFFKLTTSKGKNALVIGRKTFQTYNKPLKDRMNVVMTSSPGKYGKNSDELLFTDYSPERIINLLEEQGYENCFICGGNSVYTQFLETDLIDEFFLTVESVIFSSGIPLFGNLSFDKRLVLISKDSINCSTLILKYKKYGNLD